MNVPYETRAIMVQCFLVFFGGTFIFLATAISGLKEKSDQLTIDFNRADSGMDAVLHKPLSFKSLPKILSEKLEDK